MNILTTLLTAGVNTATTVANAMGDDFLNESIAETSAMAGEVFNHPRKDFESTRPIASTTNPEINANSIAVCTAF